METREQIAILNESTSETPFSAMLDRVGLSPLKATGIAILQLNITKRCNLNCKHCHVEAGPHRTEYMSRDTMEKCLSIAARPEVTTVDITGGAPEMHPDLPWLIARATQLRKRTIVRSNLVILLEDGFRDLPGLYAAHKVEVVGSLPDYQPDRSDRLRGQGNFARSIEAIRALNDHGYGSEGTGLVLDLMHNPAGAYLPACQQALEHEYRRHLLERFDLRFSRLYSLTNVPVGRYLEYLLRTDNLRDYMDTLRNGFNPLAARNVMCRTTLSVGWDGTLFDCDFNQMLGMSVNHGAPSDLDRFDYTALASREIMVNNHCYSCTAGAGSSCQGATDA